MKTNLQQIDSLLYMYSILDLVSPVTKDLFNLSSSETNKVV